MALHNLAGRPVDAAVVLDDAGDGAVLVDLFADDDVALDGGRARIGLGPYGARWLRVRRRGQRIVP